MAPAGRGWSLTQQALHPRLYALGPSFSVVCGLFTCEILVSGVPRAISCLLIITHVFFTYGIMLCDADASPSTCYSVLEAGSALRRAISHRLGGCLHGLMARAFVVTESSCVAALSAYLPVSWSLRLIMMWTSLIADLCHVSGS